MLHSHSVSVFCFGVLPKDEDYGPPLQAWTRPSHKTKPSQLKHLRVKRHSLSTALTGIRGGGGAALGPLAL